MITKQLPSLEIENKFLNKGVICGIDEVGRGCLAGPVVASAVILDINNIPKGINDSKKLSKNKRYILYEEIMKTSSKLPLDKHPLMKLIK